MKEIRDKYGEIFHIVMYEDRLELIPVGDDPPAAIREAAGDLREASTEGIRTETEAAAKASAREQDADS